MTRKITKTSSIGDYIRDMEETYRSTIDEEHIGMNIVHVFSASYSNKPAPKVNPSANHKKAIVSSVHARLRKLWLGLRFAKYDIENPLQTYSYMSPTEINLEGTIELLRELRGADFFREVRDATVEASDEYYAGARLPYLDSWRIYDIMHNKLLQKIVRSSDRTENICGMIQDG